MKFKNQMAKLVTNDYTEIEYSTTEGKCTIEIAMCFDEYQIAVITEKMSCGIAFNGKTLDMIVYWYREGLLAVEGTPKNIKKSMKKEIKSTILNVINEIETSHLSYEKTFYYFIPKSKKEPNPDLIKFMNNVTLDKKVKPYWM
jgi:hypothetical protein